MVQHDDNSPQVINANMLARVVPISELSAAHREELCAHAALYHLAGGESLNGTPELAVHLMYVVDGVIDVSGGPYPMQRMDSESATARFSIAGMESPQRRVTALRGATLLKVDRAKVSTMLLWAKGTGTEGNTANVVRERADIAAWLLDSELLARIPTNNIHRIAQHVERVQANAGDIAVNQGQPGEHYFIVESGRCEVLQNDLPAQTTHRLAQLEPGCGFGEEALLCNAQRNATVRMLSAGTLLRLHRQYFIELMAKPLLRLVSAEQAEQLVSNGARWLDVRTQREFASDALETAIHLPLQSLRQRFHELPRNTSFITYCDSGRRARTAAFLMAQNGIQACCLGEGIHPRRPRPAPSAGGAAAPSALHVELERADEVLEHAIQDMAAAQAQQLVQSQRLAQTSRERERADGQQQATAATVARAGAFLEQVMAHKLTLDLNVRDAQAAAASRRRHVDAQCERMRQHTQVLLEKEKQQLAEQYREASARLQCIEQARKQDEARFEAERQRVQSEYEAARSRIEEEAQLVRSTMESARKEAESRAETLREQYATQEQQLRLEMEAVLAEEDTQLQSQIEHSALAQQQARRHLASTQAAQQAAEMEAARSLADNEHEELLGRDLEQRAQESQAQHLVLEQEAAARRLESARLEREAAEQRRSEVAEAANNSSVGSARQEQMLKDLENFDQALQIADDRLIEAEQAHDDATEDVEVAGEVAATIRQTEEQLRLQLYEEMEEFISDEERRSADVLEQTERYAQQLEQIQQNKVTRRLEEEKATANMFEDLKGILETGKLSERVESFARERLTVEEKARLIRSARQRAEQRTRAAREAVETSRRSESTDD